MKKRLIAAALFVGLALCVSCREAAPPERNVKKGNAVATVAGGEITSQMLRAELEKRFRERTSELTTEQKLNVLDTLIQTEALYAKARADGFDRSPQMEARIKSMVASQFKEARFSAPQVTVTDAEVENFYNANKSRYAVPASVRAAVILLTLPANATPEKQGEFRALAEAVLAEARAAPTAQDFAEVVRRHSEDQTSRYRGGDLGWLSAGVSSADPKLVDALLTVEKPGQFASLIYTARGVFIAKLLESKQAGFKGLPEVRESIRYQLARQKTEQAEASIQAAIRQGLNIEIDQQLVEAISLPMEKSQPPKMPGTQRAQLRQ